MSLEFYQLTRIVELAYIQDQPETIGLLLMLSEEAAKRGSTVESDIIRHAAAQLARGQSIQVIRVDGSASSFTPDVPIPEPTPEPVPAPPAPSPDVPPRRKRRV
jgi:hypothetical protein